MAPSALLSGMGSTGFCAMSCSQPPPACWRRPWSCPPVCWRYWFHCATICCCAGFIVVSSCSGRWFDRAGDGTPAVLAHEILRLLLWAAAVHAGQIEHAAVLLLVRPRHFLGRRVGVR